MKLLFLSNIFQANLVQSFYLFFPFWNWNNKIKKAMHFFIRSNVFEGGEVLLIDSVLQFPTLHHPEFFCFLFSF